MIYGKFPYDPQLAFITCFMKEMSMNYTALFIEILIVGVQASTWFVLIVIKILDKSQISSLISLFVQAPVVSITVMVPWIYTIGIIVDRICDRLFWIPGSFVLKKRSLTPDKFKDIAVSVIEKSGASSYEIYRYYLSRLRIMRAAIINIPCFWIVIICLYTVSLRTVIPFACITSLIIGLAYITLIDRYFDRTLRIYSTLQPRPSLILPKK